MLLQGGNIPRGKKGGRRWRMSNFVRIVLTAVWKTSVHSTVGEEFVKGISRRYGIKNT